MKKFFFMLFLITFIVIGYSNAQCIYTEDFEAVTPPALPANATTIDGGTAVSANDWITTIAQAQSGANSVCMLYDYGNTVDRVFVLGPFDCTSINDPFINFYERALYGLIWTLMKYIIL